MIPMRILAPALALFALPACNAELSLDAWSTGELRVTLTRVSSSEVEVYVVMDEPEGVPEDRCPTFTSEHRVSLGDADLPPLSEAGMIGAGACQFASTSSTIAFAEVGVTSDVPLTIHSEGTAVGLTVDDLGPRQLERTNEGPYCPGDEVRLAWTPASDTVDHEGRLLVTDSGGDEHLFPITDDGDELVITLPPTASETSYTMVALGRAVVAMGDCDFRSCAVYSEQDVSHLVIEMSEDCG